MFLSSASLTPGLFTFPQDLPGCAKGSPPRKPALAPQKVQCPCQQLGGWLGPGEQLLQGGLVSTAGWGLPWLRSGAGKRPRCGWWAHIKVQGVFPACRPWSRFTSLTRGQPFPPLEKSSISTQSTGISPPCMTFHHRWSDMGPVLLWR